jgi:hypothetical protein
MFDHGSLLTGSEAIAEAPPQGSWLAGLAAASAGMPQGSTEGDDDEAAVRVGGGGCATGLPKSKSSKSLEGFPLLLIRTGRPSLSLLKKGQS